MEGWPADAIFSSSVFLLVFLQSSFSLPSFPSLLWVPSSLLISLPLSTVFYFVHFVCVLETKAKLGTLAFCSFLFLVCVFGPLSPRSFFLCSGFFFLWFFVPFSVQFPPSFSFLQSPCQFVSSVSLRRNQGNQSLLLLFSPPLVIPPVVLSFSAPRFCPFFILPCVHGLSLAFIKPENAMRSPLNNEVTDCLQE